MKNKDAYFMQLAFDVANASRCKRAQYGSVIVTKDLRVVSTAYNGKPRCSINDHICYREGLEANAEKPNCCLHSECNAIMFSSPEERLGGTLYVSGVPCTDCALAIAQAGIVRVVYFNGGCGDHKGNFDQSFADKYGMKVEFVPFSFGEEE